LPFELTNASDFPIILDRQRSRVPQGRAPTVFVALLDERSGMGGHGWIAVGAGAASNLLVRSPVPLEGVTIGIKSVSPCDVGVTASRVAEQVALGVNDRRDLEIHPSQVFSRDSYVFILGVDASRCAEAIEVAMQAHARVEANRNEK
jgi:hypothetical protein